MVFITALFVYLGLIKFWKQPSHQRNQSGSLASAVRSGARAGDFLECSIIITASFFHTLTGLPGFLHGTAIEVPLAGRFVKGLWNKSFLYREPFFCNKLCHPPLFRSQRTG
jgi:hypothetical protein